ncbi:MAG: hypothetical protein H6Q13_908 [Bacteroidetes bacterium]|jgi:hypothetical protein|nr:hypothetical protein [Bacteroidota bacterium]
MIFFSSTIANMRELSTFAPAIRNDGHYLGLVVQLVRIHACHAWGRGFESRPDRQEIKKSLMLRY